MIFVCELAISNNCVMNEYLKLFYYELAINYH